MPKKVKTDNYAPPGWRTVTPRLFVRGSRDLCAFLRKVFAATGRFRADRPTEMRIGDCIVMVTEVGDRAATRACLYVYVRNVDREYLRALKAGARGIEPPSITSYGERRCIFEDRWGTTWQVAERKR